MRILADSNIFVDFWRNPSQEMIDRFRRDQIVICGVVRSELLHGAVSEKNLGKIREALKLFDSFEMSKNDWDTLGEQLYTLRIHGLTVPLADAIIACLAIKNDVPVWTRDNHFNKMQEILRELKVIV